MNLTGQWVGELASLCAALTWSCSVMLFRRYGREASATWLTFYKGAVAMLLFGVAIWGFGEWHFTSWIAISILAVSGLIGIVIGDSAFFKALPKIGGPLTSAIQCAAPPLTAIGAWIFLDETLSTHKIIGLIITSAGVAAMVWFERRSTAISAEPKALKVGVICAAIAAVCQAIGVLLSRQPLEGLPVAQGSALRMWVPVLVLGMYEWWRVGGTFQGFVRVTAKTPFIWQLTLASFLGSFLGLMLMVYGMTHAPVGIALGINSTYPLWIVIFDVAIFGHKMRKSSIASLIFAILGIFMMVL
jgi:drug/metabolite transporter (DMT)-like permease